MYDYIHMIQNDIDLVPAVLFLAATAVLFTGVSAALFIWLYQTFARSKAAHLTPLRLGSLSLICCIAITAAGLSLQGLSNIWSGSAALLKEDLSLNTRTLTGIGMFIAGIVGLLLAHTMMNLWSDSVRNESL